MTLSSCTKDSQWKRTKPESGRKLGSAGFEYHMCTNNSDVPAMFRWQVLNMRHGAFARFGPLSSTSSQAASEQGLQCSTFRTKGEFVFLFFSLPDEQRDTTHGSSNDKSLSPRYSTVQYSTLAQKFSFLGFDLLSPSVIGGVGLLLYLSRRVCVTKCGQHRSRFSPFFFVS